MALKNNLYPDFWKDDERMDVLMSPFRPKSLNPVNYESKLYFWKSMIKKYCETTGCGKFSKAELLLSFQRGEDSPYCLDHVLDDMLKNNDIKTLKKFNEDIEDSWSIWALKYFVKTPFVWAIEKTVGPTLLSSNNYNIDFIHIDVLEKQSIKLLDAIQRLNRKFIQQSDLNSLKDINLNEDGKELCLRHLHATKKLYIDYQLQNTTRVINIIKVPPAGQVAQPITDFEWTLFNLENTKKSLGKNIDDLHIEMKCSEDSARKYVKEGKKLLAKASLRKKHLTERLLEKRIIAQDNICFLINSLQDAQDDEAVISAMKSGSHTLKSLLKSVNLNLDNVDNIVTEVRETLEMKEEIQRTVSEPITDFNIDDSVLEEELNEILSQSQEEKSEIINNNINKEIDKNNKNKLDDEDIELMKYLDQLTIENDSPQKEESDAKTPSPVQFP